MADSYDKPRPLKVNIYKGEIVAADTMPFYWRVSPNNPDGMTVRFVVKLMAEDGPATVTDAVDAANIQRLISVFRSADLKEPENPEEMIDNAHTLRGRPCLFATKNITPRQGKHAGKEKAVISRWLSEEELKGIMTN